MSRAHPLRCAALLLVLAACGGGGGSDVKDPLNDNDLSDAEAAAVATEVATAMASGTQSADGSPGLLPSGRSSGFSYPMNGSHPCAISGHITWTGNLAGTVNPDTGAWTVGSAIQFNLGDRTNNLNDCQVSSGVFVDGTLNLVIGGNNVEGVGASMNGQISLNNRGPTGGLVPRGSCWVFLTVQRGANRATGSVCGHAVQ